MVNFGRQGLNLAATCRHCSSEGNFLFTSFLIQCHIASEQMGWLFISGHYKFCFVTFCLFL